MRSSTIAAWRLPANRWLDVSVAASSIVVASIVFLPVGHEVFATTGLDLTGTLIVGVLAILPLTGIELLKAAFRRRPSRLRQRGNPV